MKPDALNALIGRSLAVGQRFRQALIDAISEAELDTAGHKAKILDDLLAEARTYLQTIDDATVPTVSTRTQAAGVPVIVITCSEGLNPDVVPPLDSIVISSPSRTVTGIEIRGATIRVSYSGVVLTAGDTPEIAYTQPTDTTLRVRDQAGNLLASFTAAAVTVS